MVVAHGSSTEFLPGSDRLCQPDMQQTMIPKTLSPKISDNSF
ncbi:hypothetical protein CAter10_3991 [Collimonas arenae]|nr:hypothetical protein CAter10_3991 [Collimonas arenae]